MPFNPPVQDTGTDLRLKKENIAQYNAAVNPPDTTPKAPPPSQNPNGLQKPPKKFYGTRPGEKRIDVTDMVKPLGSFKDGTDYVPKTGNYKLHEGEKVIPKEDNMTDIYAHVPGRGAEKKPKKEIKHIITSKTHDGKYLHKHVHHNPAHEDETHVSSDMAELHNHFEDHAGTPNEGEAAPTGPAPTPMTPSPSPVPPAAPMGE